MNLSEMVQYKGVLKKIEKLEGETLEEQCKRLLENKELPSYHDSYAEFLLDQHYKEMTIQGGVLYHVEKEKLDPEDNMFNASIEDNGDISFEVRYYNGGCGFDEAIENAMKQLNN